MSSGNMEDKIKRVFKDNWGFDVRQDQLKAVLAALEGKDVFVGLATGQGKSLCYQCLPLCVTRPQLVVVVSPLRALISDQIHRFQQQTGYTAVHLKTAHEARKFKEEDDKGVRLVFMGPEEFISPDGRDLLQQPPLPIAMVAVDEAHCIPEWGKDFRTSFDSIGSLRAGMGGVPFMALTATATPKVQKVVIRKLNMENPVIIRGSLDRKNIFLVRRKTTSIKADLQPLLDAVKQAKEPTDVEKHLIYLSAKRKVMDIWALFNRICNPAMHRRVRVFHADSSPQAKDTVLKGFRDGSIRVVIATVAFGMGIDIPDVKGVVVYGMPSTLGQLYQQIGRAGRSGDQAYAVVFHSAADAKTTDEGTAAFIKTDRCLRKELLHHLGEKENEKEMEQETEKDVEEDVQEEVEEEMEEEAEEEMEEEVEEEMEEEVEEEMEEDVVTCCSICGDDNVDTFLFTSSSANVPKRVKKRQKPRPTRQKDTGNEDVLKERLFDMRDEWFEETDQFRFIGPCGLMADAAIKRIVDKVHTIHTVQDLTKTKGVPEEKKETILSIIDNLIPEKPTKPTAKRRKTQNNTRVLRDITNTVQTVV